MFTKEVIVNGVFRIAPQMDTHRFMTLCERGCTGFSLTLSLFFTIIFMPARVEADPMEAKLIMNRIGFYQMGLIAQSLPATMLLMYGPNARPVPMILADVSSLIMLPALSLGFFEKKYYGSNVPEAPADLWLHPVVISTLINTVVMLATNAVLPDGIANAFNFKGEKEPLTYDMIQEIMKGTVETCFSPFGRAMYALLIVLSIPFQPWYGTSYNGCDIETYAAHNDWIVDNSLPKPPDCEPEGLSPCKSFNACGGTMIGAFVTNFPITSLMMFAWRPDPVAGLGNEAAQAEEKA